MRVSADLSERDGGGGHVEEEGLSVLGRRGHRQRVRAEQRLRVHSIFQYST